MGMYENKDGANNCIRSRAGFAKEHGGSDLEMTEQMKGGLLTTTAHDWTEDEESTLG